MQVSRRVVNPNQLKMLMTGAELKATIVDSTDRQAVGGPNRYRGERLESLDEMWGRKEAEARSEAGTVHGGGLYDSIKYGGWWDDEKPIKMSMTSHGAVTGDAHHRIAALAAVDKDHGRQTYVPVQHEEGRHLDADFAVQTPDRLESPSPSAWYDSKLPSYRGAAS